MMIQRELCAEREKEEVARHFFSRIGGVILLVTLLCAVGAWHVLQAKVDRLGTEYVSAQAQLRSASESLKEAQQQAKQMQERAGRQDAVLDFSKVRMKWAQVLEVLISARPASVRYDRLRLVEREHYFVVIAGRTAAAKPRLESDRFRIKLGSLLSDIGISASSRFIELEDSDDPIQVGGVAYPVARFSMELAWSQASDEE